MPSQIDERDAFLNYIFHGLPYTQNSTWYVGLLTANPTGAPGNEGTEVAGNNYDRQSITLGVASGGTLTSVGDVDFPAAIPSGWGAIVGIGLYDDNPGGHLRYYKEINTFTVLDNMLVKILDGDLDVVGV